MEPENENSQELGRTKQAAGGKGMFKWIVIPIMLLVFLGAGGFLGRSIFLKGNQPKTQNVDPGPADEHVGAPVIFPLKTFIVNLMDKTGLGKRYLKITMELEIEGDEAIRKSIDSHTSQLRDTVLLLLSSLSFNEINSMEGKLELKQVLMTRINQVLGTGTVRNIYFTEFVVQ